MTEAYLDQLDAWKLQRRAALTAPNGWLNIIGRWTLSEGSVSLGNADNNDLVLPAGPARLGTLTQEAAGLVTFVPAGGGESIRLVPNKKSPPRFERDGLLVEITTLNGENAVRIRDTRSAAPAALEPLIYFPADPNWRITALWVPYGSPREVTVGTTKDIDTEVEVTHKAVFEKDGRTIELIATHGTPVSPQFVIRDLTSRDTTYPASRFVYGEAVTETTIVLDFNKAINPPCAFTEFAVCPLPPPENVLPIRIEAGEKRLSSFH